MKNRERESRQLIKAIDPYLPPSFRNNADLSLEDLIRARVLVAIMLSAIIATASTMLLLVVFYEVSHSDFSNPLIILFISGIILTIDYIFFYKSGRLDASAVLFSLTFFSAILISNILTGGFDSPVRVMLVCSPIVAFLVGGRQEGIYHAALSFVAGIILLILKAYEFPMTQIMPEEILPYLSGIVWLLSLILVVVCLYVYDVLLEDMRDTTAHIASITANEAGKP